ncbi:EAL domain-containing response regulator [Pseudomonas sp.]|uniref:EAL domain-containing response regulator n=1 Tax=Pseudomonas sp. TaxID=306 RepID=UPI003D10E931
MYPRVLVLSADIHRAGHAAELLLHAGVEDLIEACNGKQAMAILHEEGGTDVIVCDLDFGGMAALECLHGEHQLQQASALIICGDIDGEECRRVLQIVSLSGLQFLGALASPLQAVTLKKALQRFKYPETRQRSQPVSRIAEPELRRALDLGEFSLWLQPRVDMNSQALVGLEALARWNHLRSGLLLPQDFLPAMLACNLLGELFEHLFEPGVTLAQRLLREGRRLELAFNLHGSQLQGPETISLIERVLEQHQVPASALVFEIGEYDLLNTSRAMRLQLLRLHRLGCKIGIDDFGTGALSLKQLCQFPIAQMLLGPEFTEDLSDPRNRAVVLGALSLAEALDIQVVAKGVSSAVARDNLLAMGCSLGQGFYFAQPMTVPSVLEWLERCDGEKENVQ